MLAPLAPGSAAGGAVGAGGGGGEVGGFGIQTHVYGVDMPSPRSSYRPVENCTTFGVGATETVLLGVGA